MLRHSPSFFSQLALRQMISMNSISGIEADGWLLGEACPVVWVQNSMCLKLANLSLLDSQLEVGTPFCSARSSALAQKDIFLEQAHP